MITYTTDSIWILPNDHWRVIPVNCVRIAGKGLAKQWAQRKDQFPYSVRQYTSRTTRIYPGEVIINSDGIILAATKDHWCDPSNLEWIENICDILSGMRTEQAIVVPPLGCGLGGLDWTREVQPVFEAYFKPSKNNFIVTTYGQL